jgi:nucleoside-diphosphate-sugar epimerase
MVVPTLDIPRARVELGYEPKFDVEAGLRDFIEEMGRT